MVSIQSPVTLFNARSDVRKKVKSPWRIVVWAFLLLAVTACAGTPDDQHSTDGSTMNDMQRRIGLYGVWLGDSRDQVFAALNAYAAEGESCTLEKVAIRKSRKAYLYERCHVSLKPDAGWMVGDWSANSVTLHFLEARLERLDASGDNAPVDLFSLADEVVRQVDSFEQALQLDDDSSLQHVIYRSEAYSERIDAVRRQQGAGDSTIDLFFTNTAMVARAPVLAFE